MDEAERLASFAQSNVDSINYMLRGYDGDPSLHEAEKLDEWWRIEVGEHPAMYITQAILHGNAWADLIAWLAWGYRRMQTKSSLAR